MKRGLFLLISFCLLFSAIGSGQKTESRLSVQLSAGAAVPLGDFAKKIYSYRTDSTYGIAKTGPAIQLKLTRRINPSLSVSAILGASFNQQDKKAYEAIVSSGDPNNWTTARVHYWKSYRLMVGAEYWPDQQKQKKIQLCFSVHAGISKSVYPGYEMVFHTKIPGVDDYVTGAAAHEREPLQPSFCYRAGASGIYKLSGNWFLSGEVAFFNAQKAKSALYSSSPYKYAVTTINALFGIGVDL